MQCFESVEIQEWSQLLELKLVFRSPRMCYSYQLGSSCRRCQNILVFPGSTQYLENGRLQQHPLLGGGARVKKVFISLLSYGMRSKGFSP